MFVSFLACRTDTHLSEVSWMGFWLPAFKLVLIQFYRGELKIYNIQYKVYHKPNPSPFLEVSFLFLLPLFDVGQVQAVFI